LNLLYNNYQRLQNSQSQTPPVQNFLVAFCGFP